MDQKWDIQWVEKQLGLRNRFEQIRTMAAVGVGMKSVAWMAGNQWVGRTVECFVDALGRNH